MKQEVNKMEVIDLERKKYMIVPAEIFLKGKKCLANDGSVFTMHDGRPIYKTDKPCYEIMDSLL